MNINQLRKQMNRTRVHEAAEFNSKAADVLIKLLRDSLFDAQGKMESEEDVRQLLRKVARDAGSLAMLIGQREASKLLQQAESKLREMYEPR